MGPWKTPRRGRLNAAIRLCVLRVQWPASREDGAPERQLLVQPGGAELLRSVGQSCRREWRLVQFLVLREGPCRVQTRAPGEGVQGAQGAPGSAGGAVGGEECLRDAEAAPEAERVLRAGQGPGSRRGGLPRCGHAPRGGDGRTQLGQPLLCAGALQLPQPVDTLYIVFLGDSPFILV